MKLKTIILSLLLLIIIITINKRTNCQKFDEQKKKDKFKSIYY